MPNNNFLSSVDRAIEEVKRRKSAQKDTNAVVESLKGQLVEAIKPTLEQIAAQFKEALSNIKIEPTLEVPPLEVSIPPIQMPKMPEFKIPTPQVTVKSPVVNVPEMKMPERMIVDGAVSLKGYDAKNPMPVLLHGTDGKPFMFPITGPGSKANFLVIKDILTKSGDSILDDTNDAMKVNVVAGSTSGTQYNEGDVDAVATGTAALAKDDADTEYQLRIGSGVSDKALRVVMATDVGTSVNISGFSASVATVIQTAEGVDCMDDGNQAVRVNVVAGSTAGTQYTDGDVDSTPTGTVAMAKGYDADTGTDVMRVVRMGDGESTSALRVVQASDIVSSVSVKTIDVSLETKQVSGLADSMSLISLGADSLAKAREVAENDGGFLRVLQATDVGVSTMIQGTPAFIREFVENEQTFIRVIHATDIGVSTRVNSVDTSLEVKQVSGMIDSVYVTGFGSTVRVEGSIEADAADDGSPPVKIGGIARQANPGAAMASGDRISATFDDVGRQVMRPLQVRDLMGTAYATLSTGTETSLIAGTASEYHDLVYVMGANTSSVATQVDIRDCLTGNVVLTLELPANGTAGVSLPVPIPQSEAGNSWTADMPDITGTTVYVSALYTKEI